MFWAFATAVAGVPDFGPPIPLLDPVDPAALSFQGGGAVSDVDGDGDWDLVLPLPQSVAVLLQDPSAAAEGRFEPLVDPFPAVIPALIPMRGSAVGDLDDDGLVDLILWSTRNLRLYRHLGTDPPSWDRVDLGPDNLFRNIEGGGLVDLDRDGRLEAVLPHADNVGLLDFTVIVDWDPATNGFEDRGEPVVDIAGDRADFAALVDVDGDRTTDLVQRSESSPHVYLLDPSDGGRFDAHPQGWGFAPGDQFKAGLATCDIDGDEDLDLVWPNVPPSLNGDPREGLYLNDGTGAFSLGGLFGDGPLSRGAACGDLDHDGILDILVASDERLALWAPNAEGWSPTLLGSSTLSVATADLDDDGDLDLVTTHDDPLAPASAAWWPNPLPDPARRQHLQVRVQHVLGSCEAGDRRVRDDFGSRLRLTSSTGERFGLREVIGTAGRNQTGWPVVHWGGIDPDARHRLLIESQASDEAFSLELTPSDLGDALHRLVVQSDDRDGDGLRDVEEAVWGDLDQDGVPAELDDDADGDGIPDRVEAGDDDPCTPAADEDGNGIADAFEAPAEPEDTGDPPIEDTGSPPHIPSVRGQAPDVPIVCGCTTPHGPAGGLGLWLIVGLGLIRRR